MLSSVSFLSIAILFCTVALFSGAIYVTLKQIKAVKKASEGAVAGTQPEVGVYAGGVSKEGSGSVSHISVPDVRGRDAA